VKGGAVGVGTRPVKPVKIGLLLGFEDAVVAGDETAGDFETPLEQELEDTHGFYRVVIYCLLFDLIVGFSLF
jgi:hypothetical protein